MKKDKKSTEDTNTEIQDDTSHVDKNESKSGFSRRDFLAGSGIAATAALGIGFTGGVLAKGSKHHKHHDHGHHQWHGKHHRRILLKNATILSMDPNVGDFDQADVLIEGSKIKEVGRNIHAHAKVIDCKGMIVMPGFIDTHHHQYETNQRGIIADGVLFGDWPQRTYVSVVQGHWTQGSNAQVPFDLGQSPYDPEDNYISELVASLSQISAGVTTGIDVSQSSHSPEHTDAMIMGLKDAGRRTLYAYSGGRSDGATFEYPGTIGDYTSGIGRLRDEHFSSSDQLITLGLGAGLNQANLDLARAFDAPLVSHVLGQFGGAATIDAMAAAGELGPDQVYIHLTQMGDDSVYQKIKDSGGHPSIATAIEMQMQHGMPPIQQCLDAGIVPSLSCDVETNMSADLFTVMKATFTLQRALINERVIGGETDALGKLVTCEEVLEMATIAGAKAAQLGDKVGSLTPGKEADIIVLDANRINCIPMNNAPGTVVTMMDTSNVRHVLIAGKVRKWDYELVGVDVDKLRRDIEASRDRVLGRLKAGNPSYVAPTLSSCCVPSYQ